MDNIQDILLQTNLLTEPAVLATIIHIEGSAYRKVGATMLITKTRHIFGTISGGCLEEDLTERALLLMENEKSLAKIIRYNMAAEDDLGWGRGAGCNGLVSILLEKIEPHLTETLQKVTASLEQGVSVRLTRNIKFLNRNSANDEQAIKVATSMLTNPKMSHDANYQIIQTNRLSIFEQTITPKPRLIIFGAGNDVPFLAKLATDIGFAVTIWDWRKTLLNQSTFKNNSLIYSALPEYAWEQLKINSNDYLLVMTHDFQMDKEILQLVTQLTAVNYLGVLGPSRRTNRLLTSINPFIHPIHSPVGLAIGAEGPKEIAISILAELIACKRKVLNEQRAFID